MGGGFHTPCISLAAYVVVVTSRRVDCEVTFCLVHASLSYAQLFLLPPLIALFELAFSSSLTVTVAIVQYMYHADPNSATASIGTRTNHR